MRMAHLSPLSVLALASAACAASILIAYLVRRPHLDGTQKLWLLLGLGALPIAAALTGNLHGFETTKERAFCGSCHVMGPYVEDSEDPHSPSLASRHARNAEFGSANCYMCHADYGMFGTVITKLGGMKHVWMYYTRYRTASLEEAKKTIHLYEPFPNASCMHCHSTELALWQKVPDHASALDELRSGRVSCASAGCHGFAHPFTKPAAPPFATPRTSAENGAR
jgi:nitrate/TMAO reductase-like tetraheme cytochrome c subunit